MSQNTNYNLANQTGASFRAELNNTLLDIVSNNSGATEPATMFAYELWVDTSSSVMKIRNSGNNAWITLPWSITANNTVDINGGTVNGITSLSFSSGSTVTSILDEDDLSSDSATALATQQSLKTYIDSQVTAQDLDFQADSGGVLSIDLDSETFTLNGGTGITTVGAENTVTFAIDSTVATLTGSQTLTNKTIDIDNNTLSNVEVDNLKSGVLDTDLNAVSGSDNTLASAKAIKTYVDAAITAEDLDISDGTNAGSIDLDSETLGLLGGTGVTSALSGNNITFSIGQSVGTSDNVTFGVVTAALTGNVTGQVSDISNHSTSDLSEGSNLFYTDARVATKVDSYVNKAFVDALNVVAASTTGNAATATTLAATRTFSITGDATASAQNFDGSSDVTLTLTIDDNSVALGTKTTGNYVAQIIGTTNQISVSGSGSETASVTISLPNDVSIANDLTVAGDLSINGSLTYLNTTNLKIEDNLFELNANLTGVPVNDSGMLINRGSSDNAVFIWDESADKFTLGLTTADGSTTGNITLASLGTLVANVEGNVIGSATTVTQAAQSAITSLGNLTGLTTVTASIGGGSTNGVQISQGAIKIKNGGTQSYIDFYCESNNAHYARLQAPAHSGFSGNPTLTLPSTTGTIALTSSNITGNSATATALQNARTISGVSFNGTSNITLDTDNIGEGTNNKYFTTERVDDQVNTLLTAGSNITLTYDDAAGTLTIAGQDGDITSVVAGDGLTGGGNTGNVTLAVAVDDSSIELNSDAIRVKSSGITNTMLAGSIANNKLLNSSVTVNSNTVVLGASITLDTDDIGEGTTNLYHTSARVNTLIDSKVTKTFVDNLAVVAATLATPRAIALSGDVVGTANFDGSAPISIATTIQANSVGLGTDTTGNYVSTIAGTSNEIEVSGSGSETAAVTISLPDNVTVPNNLTVSGNLTVTGTTTQTGTVITDSNFQGFADNNTGNSTDFGFYGKYVESATTKYAGIFYDASTDNTFRLFCDTQSKPTTTVNTGATGYTVATLVANLTGNADTSTSLATGRTIGMTGDVLWTSASFDGSGNVTGSATIQADAVEQSMIADDAVGADQLASNAVVTASIADDQITQAKVAANAIGIPELNVSDGTNGQALTTNGSGTLAFANVAVSQTLNVVGRAASIAITITSGVLAVIGRSGTINVGVQNE